jgi:hypothetical protein
MVLVGLALLVGACTGGGGDSADAGDGADRATAGSTPAETGPATTAPPPLLYLPSADPVFCDETRRPAGEIRGAEPNELIDLSSPLPIDLAPLTADNVGSASLTWSCAEAESRLRWDVTARGARSGRQVAFTIEGAAAEDETSDELIVEIADEPMICDGTRRAVGIILGAEPNETITFQSDQENRISDGLADQTGATTLHWRCSFDQAGTSWEVRARGVESGRVGEFTITGTEADPQQVPEMQVRAIEEPFSCDTYVRPVAMVSGFVGREVVDFQSDDADSLIDGQANAAGEITLRWQCGRADIGKTWVITVLGISSGRSTTVTITGGEPPEGTFADVAIAYDEDPFRCDGDSRAFATLSNFLSREYVDFTSADAGPMRQGQADETGSLSIRWQCDPADAGRTWDVTATGTTTGKALAFTITAAE